MIIRVCFLVRDLAVNPREICIYLEGWDGGGDGREVQRGEDTCIPMADSC